MLIGLVLAGRIGARYAAELGTMRVTEQIDALESLGRSPASHLIIPRVLAGLLMIPVLVVIADVVAVGAGWYRRQAGAADHRRRFRLRRAVLLAPLRRATTRSSRRSSSAGAIGLISCYMGFNTKQGAEGVGRSTTAAVVASSVVILLLNMLLAKCCSTDDRAPGVRKRFGEQVVLDGVDFTVRRARPWRCSGRPAPARACCSSTSSG